MSYNFKNLADVELLAEVPEGCTAFAEVDGVVKRVPSKGLGGEDGIKTAIIKQSYYDEAVEYFSGNGAAQPSTIATDERSFECINMTFDEAYQTIMSGEPLAIMGMIVDSGLLNAYGAAMAAGGSASPTGEPLIMIIFIVETDYTIHLYWTADGISTEMPGGGSEPV
jgi:hypothetical protein